MHDRDYAVAISGGGVRAAAFGLGALLYLVDARLSRRVSTIASVSGGSLTNGFVASRIDFAKASPSEFVAVAADLARRLVHRPVMGRLIIALYAVLAASGAVSLVLVAWGWPVAVPLWVRIPILPAWGLLFLLRGTLIEYLLSRAYFSASSTNGRVAPSLECRRSTAHVFSATDLGRGAPVHFVAWERGHVYCPAHGWGLAGHIKLATAVRASAAFPGAFPPRLVRSRRLQMSGGSHLGWPTETAPWALYVVDGGVWSNLATDWFGPDNPTLWRPEPQQRPSSAPSSIPYRGIRRLLAVDASTKPQGLPRWKRTMFLFPLLAEFMSMSRSIDSMYENTVTPRARQHADVLMAWLAGASGFNRWTWVPAIARLRQPALDGVSRAATMAQRAVERQSKLKRESNLNRLIEMVEDARQRLPERVLEIEGLPKVCNLDVFCSQIPTKLTSLSHTETLALVLHGYLQAAEAVFFLEGRDDSASAALLPTPDSLTARFAELHRLMQ